MASEAVRNEFDDPVSIERYETESTTASTITSHDLVLQGEEIKTTADVTSEQRFNLEISEKHHVLTRALSKLPIPKPEHLEAPGGLPTWMTGEETPPPPLNIVIQIVGSRGDVQPFVALGKVLKDKYGHRIRIATHPTFKNFVEENGLEFFSIGGDPANLMEYMVKNPGLMPGKDSLMHGDVGKRKKEIGDILRGCWRSCVETGDGMDEDETEIENGIEDEPERSLPVWRPFVANAIIANPVSFAHVHCAERLGIIVHMMFTMPWTSTQAFPHPLANIKSTNTDPKAANFISYQLVTMLTFQGLGGVINKFREEVLGLDLLSMMWFPVLASSGKLPFTYCWSPALIPKPADWPEKVHVAGFYFLPLANSYKPDPALQRFLEAGPPPVYIGFGSIVVADPNGMTNMIFEAAARAGVRALVSKGWGGLGSNDLQVPDNVFLLGNVPHDWLFQHVSAVCHHGGAGTTAAGIAAGKPTIVVPFFGDQPFWGSMINRAGAGPAPIPYKQLTVDKLAAAIKVCLKPESLAAAQRMGAQIREEDGPMVGARHFHHWLPVDKMRCNINPRAAAIWRVKRTEIRLGSQAVVVLCDRSLLTMEELKLNRPREWDMSDQPIDPITASLTSIFGTVAALAVDTATLPGDIIKSVRTNGTAKPDNRRPSEQGAPSRSGTGLTSEMGRNESVTTAGGKHNEVHHHHIRDAMAIVGHDTAHLARLPREFVLGMTRGFHNVPKLYHDRTVRQPEKVVNLRTGLKGAGKEFGYGMYDGITGLVTQPFHGAKEQGGIGFLKGVGKGFGGLLFKPPAAALGLVSYTWEGVYKESRSRYAHPTFRLEPHEQDRPRKVTLDDHIAGIWLLEGYQQLRETSEEHIAQIIEKWQQIRLGERLKKEKKERDRADKWCPTNVIARRHGSTTTETANDLTPSSTASLTAVSTAATTARTSIQDERPDSQGVSALSQIEEQSESEPTPTREPLHREVSTSSSISRKPVPLRHGSSASASTSSSLARPELSNGHDSRSSTEAVS